MERKNLLRTIQDLELRAPAVNIALEEAIGRSVAAGTAPPTLRFWRNNSAAIIGRSQAAGEELDLKRCRELGLPIVRRPSGGGTVLHHPNNLNYSLYLPETGSNGVREESLRLSRPVASTLENLGIPVRVKPNGLFVGREKIGGTAQSRRWGLLHHGTLLLEGGKVMRSMENLLRAQQADYEQMNHQLPSQPSIVSNLRELLSGKVSKERLIRGLRDEFASRLDLTPVTGSVSDDEWNRALNLSGDKYSSGDWTFRFADSFEISTKK